MGWLVLLAYFCSGTLIVIAFGSVGFATLCRVLVVGVSSLVVWELVHRSLAVSFDLVIGLPPSMRAEAVAGNPNAFAFQILMAFAVMACIDIRRSRYSLVRTTSFAGLLLAGIWIAGSRASIGALAAMVAVIPIVFAATTDRTVYFGRLALAVFAAVLALIIPDPFALSSLSHVGLAIDTAEVQADRLESLSGGFAMWASHPIFGAGLGAYVHEHIAQTGLPLIIHNSALWIGAELGLVGLCAYFLLPIVIGRAIHRQSDWAGADSQTLIVACLVAFAVMSLVHDMLYQRLLWLLLGAALASPCALARFRKRVGRVSA